MGNTVIILLLRIQQVINMNIGINKYNYSNNQVNNKYYQ